MISLIAIDDGDGWAFVRQGYGIYLIRPPYSQRQHLVEVSEATVEKAVHAHRFHPELRDFVDFDAVIAFLRGRLAEAAEARASRASEHSAAARLLRHAPPDILASYLERIERELLPGGEHGAARSLLTALIELDVVASEPALRERAVRLLEACAEASEGERARREELVDDRKDLVRRFPRAMERWGEGLVGLMRAVRQRGSLMAMGE